MFLNHNFPIISLAFFFFVSLRAGFFYQRNCGFASFTHYGQLTSLQSFQSFSTICNKATDGGHLTSLSFRLTNNNELLSPTPGNRGERLRIISINSVRKERDTNLSVTRINSAGIKGKKTDVNDNRTNMQIKMDAGAPIQLKKTKIWTLKLHVPTTDLLD